MRQAARTARRRVGVPYRRKPLRRYSPAGLKDGLGAFIAPLIGGVLFLLLYILGLLDVIGTRPALAIDAFLLVVMVLFFPLRYAHRLPTRQRVLAVFFGAAWVVTVFYPVYRRIYPGDRLFTVDATPEKLPISLPTVALGQFDMIIDGHLDDPEPGGTSVARYDLTIQGASTPSQSFQGEFKETWQRQRQGRNQPVEILRERRAITIPIVNPNEEELQVTQLRVEGQAPQILTLSLYPHLLPPWWLTVLLGAGLLTGAVLYDRATGAGETAASLVIATAAAFVAAYAFPSIGSPHPTFRELAGAAIVGALIGGPIGGLVAWSSRGRPGASSATLSARAR